jgi:ribosomal protein S18 acetylase RimI-like enzyme
MVYDVHIDEAFRGRGLGRATMLAAEDVVRSEGFGRIALNVFGGNDRAEQLYRSLGYGVDSTQLSKSLEDPR